MMNYFRVGISLLTGLNEMLNVNQERKYIEPLLVSKRHSSTFYIADRSDVKKENNLFLCYDRDFVCLDFYSRSFLEGQDF